MDGQIILSYNTRIRLFMELNDEKVYISLDLQSPILNAKMPNNVSWHTLNKQNRGHLPQEDSPLWRFLSTYNQQVPWNERLDIDDIFKFLYHYMLLGVETPSISMAFFITIPNACKRTNLE